MHILSTRKQEKSISLFMMKRDHYSFVLLFLLVLMVAEARTDLYKSEIDSEIVEKVWDQIAPGVAHEFDAPHSILAITPRPLLILNGEEDPRCPVEGLQSAMERVVEAYYLAKSPGNFKFISEPGIGHEMTPLMVKEASNWFDKFLN
ncbi:uncharacterized protein LOC18425587 isoform X2 [Amborella trichopoda]|uniref:uncharacterized protein LOC18425587 isoform X2 n=1 Tax=Amborella trichopoda TaxID=13333 RepID=UPI0009C1173E|nr:uncharacterized protein LOC18425587 isoform X2 [Amborella trichopoda]|eukprot:XP_020517736.1 uncharacterized protein LOC18425587 isoform X2 [Amborella trichopoda]